MKSGSERSPVTGTRRRNPRRKTPMELIASDTSACVTPVGKDISSESQKKLITETRKQRTWRLPQHIKIEIVKMHAEFIPTCQIQYELERRHGLKVSENAILHYHHSPKWQNYLKDYRNKFVADIESIPGYHKRVRMERMEKVFRKVENTNDIRAVIAITEHQRKEIEGDGPKHQGDNYLIQFNNMTDEQLRHELQNTIEYIKKLEDKKKLIDIGGSNGSSGVS